MAQKKLEKEDSNLKKQESDNKEEPVILAHEEAEKDIEKDPDLNLDPEFGDDLDEGELAKLEGGE